MEMTYRFPSTSERWERRDEKLHKRKSAMRISGRGLLTVVQKESKPPTKKRK